MNWLLAPQIRPFITLAAVASLLLNLALIVPSLYMLEVFDRVFSSRSVETLLMLSLLALVALALAYCMDRSRSMLLARAGRIVDEALSARALSSALDGAAMGHEGRDASALKDISRMRTFLSGPAIQAMFDAPWLPIYLALIFALHPALGLAAVVSACLLFGLGVWTERAIRTDAAQTVSSSRRAAQGIEALTRNAEVLMGMGMKAQAMRGWAEMHADVLDAQQRLGQASSSLAALGRVLRQVVQVSMLGIGAWLVIAGHASPGIMVAATVLVGRALQPVEHLISGWRSLIDVRDAWCRLAQAPASAGMGDAPTMPEVRGQLSLEGVTMVAKAGQPPVIKAVSLSVQAGECIGLIGPCGSGKTTLLRLMLGLRVPHAGKVRLDGVDMALWPREQLAGVVGYLPQDVELFAGTVSHNIAGLGPADGARVIQAAQLAGVHDLVLRLPHAYETEVGDGGEQLSGGMRQRIALARAVYGQPRLLVLDEPNANLDSEGEDALAAAIEHLKRQGCTVVLVSHRPSLMRLASKLAVLREGALLMFGPREQVMARLSGGTVHPLRRGDAAELNQGVLA